MLIGWPSWRINIWLDAVFASDLFLIFSTTTTYIRHESELNCYELNKNDKNTVVKTKITKQKSAGEQLLKNQEKLTKPIKLIYRKENVTL